MIDKFTLTMVYAAVPSVNCAGKCQRACGPISASPNEREAFELATGKLFPDALAVLSSKNCTCPLLDAVGRCSVYRSRPLICRLYGAVEGMKCPWGCRPAKYLTDDEASGLLRQLST
jgi:uncharacterized protein